MVRDTSGYCGSHTERAMDATEIIPREPHGIGRFQVVPFLRKSIRQARHASHAHANGKTMPPGTPAFARDR